MKVKMLKIRRCEECPLDCVLYDPYVCGVANGCELEDYPEERVSL